ncbi:zinc finger protein basonuclin-2 [Caerostris extrusa]|uniref:Zinc finger protein basonuclin-2 n=1 Tax=Caerostris extrusa TaxID=172846 RepID=A0AAV4MYI8_CAEEX|nr:zinc finger protein basonuclin-2 [Caerostris extrusa]
MSFSASSLNNISNTNNSSTYTTASSERSGCEDGIYCSEGEDEDTGNTAINLTRSSLTTSYMDSVYAAKKVRHLRKSANPMKRRWNPSVLATLSTNPATGKNEYNKKKINPHDGRAANPYPIIPPSGILDFANGMISSYSSGPHDGDSSSGSEIDLRPVTPRKIPFLK